MWVAVQVEGPFFWDLSQSDAVVWDYRVQKSFVNPCPGVCLGATPTIEPDWPGIAIRYTTDYGPASGMYGRLTSTARVLNGMNPPDTSFTWAHQIRWSGD